MSLTTAAASLAGLVAVGAVGVAAGSWLAQLLVARRGLSDDDLGGPERALLSIAGFVATATAFMVAHLATAGSVFQSRWIVPAFAAALIAWRWRWIPWARFAPSRAALLLVCLLTALWLTPVIANGTAAKTGDIPWHMGWTEQLLGGDPVPTGPAPAELAENSYPWGFHALVATVVRLVPTSDVSTALIILDALFLLSLPVAAACLARLVDRRAGSAAAAAVATVGGFGWVLARGAHFVTSPPEAAFGADLVIASPNAVYSLFPPPLPREFGLILLACVGLLLLRGASSATRVAAGVALGLTGLMSVPAFVAGVGWAVLSVSWAGSGTRLRALALTMGSAAGVFGLWAVPVLVNAALNGGLVNVSPQLGREWGVVSALGSWGLLLPAAAVGGFAARRATSGRRLLGLFTVVAILLALSLLRGVLDWALAGNATVLHQGRVWPLAHLLAAVLAGIAATRAWDSRNRLWRAGLCVAALVGALSPLLASVSLEGTIARGRGGFEYAEPDLREDSFVRRVADRLEPEDVVLVASPSPSDEQAVRDLALHLFSFSGARLARYDDPRLETNDLRVRYVDLARSWDARVAGDGFPDTYRVVPRDEAPRASLDGGRFAGREWVLVSGETNGE